MNLPAFDRIERPVELAAAAMLGGAVGYATFLLLAGEVEGALAYAGAAGLAAAVLCARALTGAPTREQQFRIATFAPRALEFFALEELLLTQADRVQPVGAADDELLLTDADRLKPPEGSDAEPLVLDDILGEIDPDSRVVRLFDRAAMPTPGQLKSRIDGHLQRGASAHSAPDASEALSNALAELRRSLR